VLNLKVPRRWAAALAGLVLAAGIGVAAVPQACAANARAAAPRVGLLFLPLNNDKSGLCLGVSGGSTRNGAGAVQWTCNLHKDQAWGFPAARTHGYVKMLNLNNKCLGVKAASKANGARAVIWTCNTSLNQQWKAKIIRTGPNVYELINLNSGKCLGIAKGSKSKGAAVIQWQCNGHADQHWFLSRGIA
jgi:hypothetical protein